ncbi:GNAT family N-acetyltransferase [Amnibacterium sp. CER49]|uniref:GNAT family N-acetyltransferase n=1 Tax=Amnibacterium sp. CER49 TaxID=3039161 RepID=UPI002449CB68|nr:GNAT family N-acetyltransferase [Amnibacterium sp. CER49]MDH2445238.1 GNAT family N-acetyltransferase [Amnibacterium sp. CER49]
MTDPIVRRAVPADAHALVELRAAMFHALGQDDGPADAPWRTAAGRWFAERLAEETGTAVFVVDVDGRPVSCAMGLVERRAPSPANPSSTRGHVSQVSTLPEHRRQGYARACLAALLGWFETETGARFVDLHAAPDGAALYRSLGFRDAPNPGMRLTF